MKNNRGFTFIELIVTLSIVVLIAVAVFSTLAGGINVYKRVKVYTGQQRDALLSLERLEKELNNTFTVSGIDFSGDSKSVAFAGLISPLSGNISPLGKVSYNFDGATGGFSRREQGYAEVMAKADRPQSVPVKLASLKSLSFKYCSFNRDAKIFEWKDSWSAGTGIPAGVRIEAEFDTGARVIKVSRIVFIPISG